MALTVPGQFFVFSTAISDVRVQNKLKEYILIRYKGESVFVQALDRLWKLVTPNIVCSNGMIHLIQEVTPLKTLLPPNSQRPLQELV